MIDIGSPPGQNPAMIRVQTENFDLAHEIAAIKAARRDIGGLVTFLGSVRDFDDKGPIAALSLEHYPGMTERALQEIEAEAHRRFDLIDSLIIHRYGRLAPGEDIVLVVVASHHRQPAFEACQFLIDWLKTKAPFWKLESGTTGERWVEARQSDEAAARRWAASSG